MTAAPDPLRPAPPRRRAPLSPVGTGARSLPAAAMIPPKPIVIASTVAVKPTPPPSPRYTAEDEITTSMRPLTTRATTGTIPMAVCRAAIALP